MPPLGSGIRTWGLSLGTCSVHRFGLDLIMMYSLLGRLVLEANNGLGVP